MGEARRLLDGARKDGIFYLEEGTHTFSLANGARLVVFASPATPAFGSFGFQYTPEEGHVFDIPREADVVISHGPPRHVLDVSRLTRQSCGSVELWDAIQKARPKLNVFGHIHEAWGAAVVRWPSSQPKNSPWGNGNRQDGRGKKSKEVEIMVLEDRRSVEEGRKDSKEERGRRQEKVEKVVRDGYYHLVYPEQEEGVEQTLFVNAAVPYAPGLAPWLVDVELPRSDGDGKGGSTSAKEVNGTTGARS